MESLAVQSSILGIASHGPTAVPIAFAGSLALGVFRNAMITNDDNNNDNNNDDLNAPNRRRKIFDGRSSSSSLFRNENIIENTRRPRQRRIVAPVTDTKSSDNNPVIHLYRSWMKLPQIVRFGVAGNLANLGFFFLEKVIFRLLSHVLVTKSVLLSSILLDGIEKYQDSISFFSAYIIQIVTGHLLYALLVYGMDTIDTYEKYSKTLSGQFKVYGVGLFGATFLNTFLITSGGLDKTTAFIATTATFAVFNYFLVSWVVKRAIESSSPKASAGGGGRRPPSRRR